MSECNVYVIAQAGVKFGINFTSCSESGSEIAGGTVECNFAILATTSGIYPRISLLPMLSQINTIAYFVKVKISDFHILFLRFHRRLGRLIFMQSVVSDSLSS